MDSGRPLVPASFDAVRCDVDRVLRGRAAVRRFGFCSAGPAPQSAGCAGATALIAGAGGADFLSAGTLPDSRNRSRAADSLRGMGYVARHEQCVLKRFRPPYLRTPASGLLALAYIRLLIRPAR